MLEIVVVLLLTVLNGLFALSELAIVSARPARLRAMAERGARGAQTALALSGAPGRFLPTVQVGITLIGILAGAVSGAALGERLSALLAEAGLPPRLAGSLGYGAVVTLITVLSVIIGELVPKQLALRDPERLACLTAPPLAALSRLAAPLVWLLDAGTRAAMRLLGARGDAGPDISDAEIRDIVREARRAGVIAAEEQQMIGGVLRLGDRTARGVMTPRLDVESIDVATPAREAIARIAASVHSRFPVTDGQPDNVIGVLAARDLLRAAQRGEEPDLRDLLRPAPVVPDTVSALDVIRTLQHAATPMALVHDEYGHFEGVVTPADVLEAIAGAFDAGEEDEAEEAVRRADGSWLLSGAMHVDEMAELLRIDLPEERDYDTVAGLVIDVMRRLPQPGDSVELAGWRFEVMDMDGLRVDKVLASRA
ncbi:hemolysin family protein [Camelimonas abortus]|uniref:Hemolysin family protein n=1 Tax=Camelimonas abortus TaxID=1017184 RepID=A0ABV7LES0_9HYPH